MKLLRIKLCTSCSFNAFCMVIRVFFPSITTSYVIPKLIGCVSRTLVKFQHTLAKLSNQNCTAQCNGFKPFLKIYSYFQAPAFYTLSFRFLLTEEALLMEGAWSKNIQIMIMYVPQKSLPSTVVIQYAW